MIANQTIFPVSNPAASDYQRDIDAIASISILPSLLEVLCSTTGMGFTAVGRVTDGRWIVCAVRDQIDLGLVTGSELDLKTTICHEIRQSKREVAIDHVAEHPVFYDHHAPKIYGFQSYISVPIIRMNGEFFGTLCAVDPQPASVNNSKTIGLFRLFADLIAHHLENVEKLAASESKLQEERSLTELREQFIAILGHDLKNPISAISNSAQLQMRLSSDEDILQLASIIKNSSYRIQGLIENMLDFARGRMGAGIPLRLRWDNSLDVVLTEVVFELRSIWPGRVILTDFAVPGAVNCDPDRIAQVFSNLLGNALAYGEPKAAVRVVAAIGKGVFTLSVTNAGKQIPASVLERIFQPFTRGEILPGQQGLGLGLFISAEIAKAHSGVLEVVSLPEETSFILTIPVA